MVFPLAQRKQAVDIQRCDGSRPCAVVVAADTTMPLVRADFHPDVVQEAAVDRRCPSSSCCGVSAEVANETVREILALQVVAAAAVVAD